MRTDRDISKLETGFKLKVLGFLWDQRTKDLSVFVTEAYRSQERQNRLYA